MKDQQHATQVHSHDPGKEKGAQEQGKEEEEKDPFRPRWASQTRAPVLVLHTFPFFAQLHVAGRLEKWQFSDSKRKQKKTNKREVLEIFSKDQTLAF